MSYSQRLISAFIVFHLIAITVGAIPDPESIPQEIPSNRATLTFLGTTLAPTFDALVAPELALNRVAWRATAWLRRPSRVYLRATRQWEVWNMFCRPTRHDIYMHIRYYTKTPGSHLLRVHRELIFPAHPEGSTRVIKGYSDSFRDKAIELAFDTYFARVREEEKTVGYAKAVERSEQELFPVIRPFARRYVARNLEPGERLLRAELWRGVVPNAPPGEATSSDVLAERLDMLQRYDAVTDLGLLPESELPELRSFIRDADVEWVLTASMPWR
jgi:hypothetical protein